MLCPICRKPVTLEAPEAPFCSERCRLIDFDNWASGRYVISTPALPKPEGGEDDED